MEGNKGFCQNCGRNFEKKHLSSNIDLKLKRNVTYFRNFFKIEKGNTIKMCRKCENKWLELNKIVDKKKIDEFIDKMKNNKEATSVPNDQQSNKKKATMVTNNEQSLTSAIVKENVTLVDDDHLVKAGPSGVKEQNFSRSSDNVSIMKQKELEKSENLESGTKVVDDDKTCKLKEIQSDSINYKKKILAETPL